MESLILKAFKRTDIPKKRELARNHGKYQKLVDIASGIAIKETEPLTATNILIRQALMFAGAMPWQYAEKEHLK